MSVEMTQMLLKCHITEPVTTLPYLIACYATQMLSATMMVYLTLNLIFSSEGLEQFIYLDLKYLS